MNRSERRAAKVRGHVHSQHGRADTAQKKVTRTYYMTLAVELKEGSTMLRRFHMELDRDPRTLQQSDAEMFTAQCLALLGVKPRDIADLGNDPATALAVFDTEAQCKVAYDDAVRLTDAKPDVRS